MVSALDESGASGYGVLGESGYRRLRVCYSLCVGLGFTVILVVCGCEAGGLG